MPRKRRQRGGEEEEGGRNIGDYTSRRYETTIKRAKRGNNNSSFDGSNDR